MLALGTHDGSVHVLDYSGNEVKRFQVHKATVNEICFDEAAEFVGSCSDDGTVAIHGLYTEEVYKFKYSRPVKTVALDPRYGSRKTREFVKGGLAGQLILNSRGWLGAKDNILHSGEGPIHVVRWAGTVIAWANDLGVKVYDTSVHRRIGFIERPKGSVKADQLKCHLFWEGASTLYIGWADCIKVLRVHRKQASAGSSELSIYTEIVAAFQMDFLVSGVAPFGEDIAVLAFVSNLPPETSADGAAAGEAEGQDVAAGGHEGLRPELKILTWQNEEIASDALSIHGYEHYKANDYGMEAFYPARTSPSARKVPAEADGSAKVVSGATSFTKWWADGDEPLYYIISPKDVVVGRPRDSNDRVTWLLDHQRFQQAVDIAEADPAIKTSTRELVAERYLQHLVAEGKYEEAASLTPRLLQKDAVAWERWVYLFAQLRRLPALAPHIPTEDPLLRQTAYEMVLHAFLLAPADHARLLAMVQAWPTKLYSVAALTEAVIQRIRGPGGNSEALLQTAARLYEMQGRYDHALAIYLRLQWPQVFDFIHEHNLLPMLADRVAALMSIDEVRATSLLVAQHEQVPPSSVVPSLQAAMLEAQAGGDAQLAGVWRKRLHHYLDWLFKKDATAGVDFHDLQVELYADYEPDRLMSFLVSSQMYVLESAYEVCEARGRVREMVFILGRMGATHKALHLIIQQLADIPQAVEFVQMQRDEELWELLISLVLGSADLTGSLLDHIGAHINPLRLIQQIPDGMAISNLRDRLVHIIMDFRTQTSLREGCNTILHHDCISLAQRLYREMQRALQTFYIRQPAGAAGAPGQWMVHDSRGGTRRAVDVTDLPGPCGGKQLHIKPKAGMQQEADALPKVWVGLAAPAPLRTESSVAQNAVTQQQQRPRTGSNFQAVHAAIIAGDITAEVAVVVSDVPGCKALDYAQAHGIPTIIYPGSTSDTKLSPDELADLLRVGHRVDYVLLAGYLKLVPLAVVKAYHRAMLNIHPALLPAFGGKGLYGQRVHKAVIASGARFSGLTIHFVDADYDTGPILGQRVVPVYPTDTPGQLAARVLKEEHKAYPEAVAALVDGRVTWRQDGIPIMWHAR
ncbi:hypothetical protein WJX72_006282 [[Myrmecia] bisecta]|uniref:phosphoribosylglycinamide formyltransferase 1 n=1 Tax=[Myrmecia] bisecta TaxID=41462 RepID=A0AAW1Q4B9_9CHLO